MDEIRDRLDREELDGLEALLEELPGADLASLLSELDEAMQVRLFRTLPTDLRAELLGELGEETVRTLGELAPRRLQDAVERMEPDEAADVLSALPEEQIEALLAQIPGDQAAAAERLLRYAPDSAGGLMTTEFVVLFRGLTAREAIRITQRQREAETVAHLFVADEEDRLIGHLPLHRLVFAPPDQQVGDLMEECPLAVTPETDQEELVRGATHYHLHVVPVVETDGRMVGVVTLDDILEAAEQETDEDMYRLAGTGERDPVHASVSRSTRLRLPWLLLSVLDGLLIAFLMSRFMSSGEDTEHLVNLSFFIPLIPLMGGQVAIQGSTIMVRALAVGSIPRSRLAAFLGKQLAITLLLALCCSAAAALLGGMLVQIGTHLMIAVALAVAVAIVFAGMLGMIFPLGFNALGIDPAVSSGPFITMLNDLFCICLYLALGTLLAG